VRKIHVDYTGKAVRAGMPLLSVYSPELLTAQQEYLEALKSSSADPHAPSGGESDLAVSARQRLLLWDVSAAQIDAIGRSGVPLEEVPIVAPVSGVVIEKNVTLGSAFQAGQTLYKIARVDPIWVVASIYQYELPLVREGMTASVSAPISDSPARRGRVSYISPDLDPGTRTAGVRLEVPNPSGDLKPGMLLEVSLERDLGEGLAVPVNAVLFDGARRVVFVDLGDGRLMPRRVVLGPKAGDFYAVLEGLKLGEVVVTSGTFPIAAEFKLKFTAEQF
jgi:Cu(I)/Ag(I) efflux system membrane fusion protein